MKNRNFAISWLLGASLISGCSHVAAVQSTALSPSELNINAAQYNGQDVIVRGYVTLEPEGHNLYESRERKLEFEKRWDSDKNFNPSDYVNYCLTIANPDFLYNRRYAFAGKTIIVRGKFISNYLEGRIDLGACPLPTAIMIDETDLKARYPTIFDGEARP